MPASITATTLHDAMRRVRAGLGVAPADATGRVFPGGEICALPTPARQRVTLPGAAAAFCPALGFAARARLFRPPLARLTVSGTPLGPQRAASRIMQPVRRMGHSR